MIVWSSQDIIFNYLESNESESRGDYVEHLESISNVSTDASNLERINRWNSAVAMWQERPFVGWGPGTYQRSEEHTSELQSRGHLVCRLLLEKKKRNRKQ